MQPEQRDKAYLWDMQEAAKDILSFVDGINFSEFENDKKTRYAVERQLLVIGEAANHLSQTFKDNHSAIPWQAIIGMRNIIAHEYGEILIERIWNVTQNNLPSLLDFLSQMMD